MRPQPEGERALLYLVHTMARQSHGRITGRRGQALRRARLLAEPLCRICKSKGRIRAATTPDHIKPLALGGTDTDDNIRCLCGPCHADVTRQEFGQRKRVRFGADGWPIEE